MGTYTTNYNLYKPSVGEQGWGSLVNTNFDTIDSHADKHESGGSDALSLDASQITSGVMERLRLPTATTVYRGVVKIGSGLSIDSDGTLSTSGSGSVAWDNITGKPDYIPFGANVTKSNKDSNNIYTVITWELPSSRVVSGQPAMWISTLSGGTSPNYTTRTVNVYSSDKSTVTATYVYTRSYDSDGTLISEVCS